MMPRCKHLCCREGVDRPPKAPKAMKQSIETKAKGNDSGLLAPKKSAYITNTLPFKRVSSKSDQSTIEVLDLVSKGTEPGLPYSREQGNTGLCRSYSSVMQRSPALLCVSSKTTIETARAQRTQHNPSSTIEGENSSLHETPSDFEASWMDDFPSLSAIMEEPREESIWLQQESAHGRDLAGREYSTVPSTENEDTEKCQNTDQSQHFVSGYKVSGNQQGNSDCNGPEIEPILDAADQNLDLLSEPTQPVETVSSTHAQRESRYHRLFLSTSSPEKICIDSEDPNDIVQQAQNNPEERPSKRQRLDDHQMILQQLPDHQISHQLPASSDAENHAKRLENLRKRLPWDDLEGIDLEFLLDYADIVEFV